MAPLARDSAMQNLLWFYHRVFFVSVRSAIFGGGTEALNCSLPRHKCSTFHIRTEIRCNQQYVSNKCTRGESQRNTTKVFKTPMCTSICTRWNSTATKRHECCFATEDQDQIFSLFVNFVLKIVITVRVITQKLNGRLREFLPRLNHRKR